MIHIHPFQTATTGRNARLGDFFNQTGLKRQLDEDRAADDPALGDNSGKTYKNGDKCPDGKKGIVKALVWKDAAGTAGPKVFVTDFDRIRFTNNGMAITFAFVPEDLDVNTIPKPPSAANLAELGRRRLRDAGHRQHGELDRPHGSTETTVPGAPRPRCRGPRRPPSPPRPSDHRRLTDRKGSALPCERSSWSVGSAPACAR